MLDHNYPLELVPMAVVFILVVCFLPTLIGFLTKKNWKPILVLNASLILAVVVGSCVGTYYGRHDAARYLDELRMP